MPQRLTVTLQQVCTMPEPPDGFTFVTASVSANGDGLFLFAGLDTRRRRQAASRNALVYKLCIISATEASWLDIPLDAPVFYAELFPDGRVLLADVRSSWRGPEDFDRNGVVVDPRTGAQHKILLGDGIEDVAIDAKGRIWTSYFDEGVCGTRGWGSPGPAGLGSGGLVCFDAAGKVQWDFNRGGAEGFIDDCYAMNASREEIWVFYYREFRVCRVGADFSQTFYRPSGMAGCRAFAVSEHAFLFANQYEEPKEVMHVVPRDGDRLGKPRKVFAQLPNNWAMGKAKIIGRGPNLHVLNEMGWLRTDVDSLLDAAP